MRKDENYLSDLVSYMKKNLRKGYPIESLKWALIGQDHSKIEVEKAIKLAQEQLAAEAPTLKTKPVIKYEVIEPKFSEKKSFWKKLFGN